jgi:hypothetical protein
MSALARIISALSMTDARNGQAGTAGDRGQPASPCAAE